VLVVMGGASLILPALGMQLRIFNLFGGGSPAVSIAFIVVGAVLWLVGTASRGAVPVSAPPTPPSVGRGATSAVSSVPNVAKCPKCGARANPADLFCIECGNPLPQAVAAPPPVPAAGAAAPKRGVRAGCMFLLLFLVLVTSGTAWFFFGPSKSYSLPTRLEPSVPQHMAGTLTEFPVDPAPNRPMQPTGVVSQSFEPSGQPSAAAKGIQASSETFPPGLNTGVIPQVASAMTSCTYRIDPNSPPVHVHVLQAGTNIAVAGQFAQGVAQSTGGTLQNARVQSPQGLTYEGYGVRSATILVYILFNRNAGNIIILYTPQPQGFEAVQRLAGSVGNGRGLLDYPQIVDTYTALPAVPPPGYRMTGIRGFTGGELRSAMGQAQAEMGKDVVAALAQILEAVRLLIPERGTLALYEDSRRQEKGVLIGSYGSSGKASVAWRVFFWTFGWGMKKNNSLGFDALIAADQEARIMLFQKGPYIGMAKVPGSSSEQELLSLATSLQF
jgi:hypothetical protein